MRSFCGALHLGAYPGNAISIIQTETATLSTNVETGSSEDGAGSCAVTEVGRLQAENINLREAWQEQANAVDQAAEVEQLKELYAQALQGTMLSRWKSFGTSWTIHDSD